MTLGIPYGKGTRMLTLSQLCEWLNITERHARKLVERDAIPYRKVGNLLRFPEAEVEEWCRPAPKPARPKQACEQRKLPHSRRSIGRAVLPKSLIE